MIGKGSLPVIQAHWQEKADDAYRLGDWAAKNGSSRAYGTYSTANYWFAEAVRCEKKAHRAISLENRLYDREQDRIKQERWEFMEQTLREAYPTRIPEEWLK